LPKHILSVEEAGAILQQATPSTAESLRDRAILETLFATGMRRMEIVNLKVYDIDRERGTVMIRQGKGKKDRHIPIGERALAWIGKYLAEGRPELLGGTDDGRSRPDGCTSAPSLRAGRPLPGPECATPDAEP
jgi:integrase/recombinase XerD